MAGRHSGEGSNLTGAAENGEITDTHTEKLGLVVLLDRGSSIKETQHVYYTQWKEEVDQLISVGDLCREAGSGCSLWGIRKLAWPSCLERPVS